MNDSSTGGYLVPFDAPPPLNDTALVVALQQVVAGITAMNPTLVRPRWQPIPPKQPEFTVDWCSVGATDVESDTMDSQVTMDPTLINLPFPVGSAPVGAFPVGGGPIGTSAELNGYVEAIENERLVVVASFYGPNAVSFAKLLRGGLKVAQNREPLYAIQAGLMSIGTLRYVPELINEQWIQRVDFDFVISRAITRLFYIDGLASAAVALTVMDSAGAHVINQSFGVIAANKEG